MRYGALILIVALAGCHRESADYAQSGPSQSTTAMNLPQTGTGDRSAQMNPVIEPDRALPGNESGPPTISQPRVELIEYQIRMPQTLAPGKHGFTVVNAGKEMHSFAIEGTGARAGLASPLPRGNSETVEVTLPAGTYTVYCPIAGHREKGMETRVEVR